MHQNILNTISTLLENYLYKDSLILYPNNLEGLNKCFSLGLLSFSADWHYSIIQQKILQTRDCTSLTLHAYAFKTIQKQIACLIN